MPQYEQLRSDHRRRHILIRADRILDALEEDPGQAWLRAHRFQDPPLWYIPFDAAGETWAILWSFDGDDRERVLITYIGRASFA